MLMRGGMPCCFGMLSRGARASATAVGASDPPAVDKTERWDHWDCSIHNTPTYLLQLTLKPPPTKINENMSASKYE